MTSGTVEGLFLHASAVVVDGGAVLFLGHSTAGKSTLARMLAATFPVLADDAVFAARDSQGKWRVVEGGFRFEDGDIGRRLGDILRRIEGGGGILVRGCFRLQKAETIKVEPASPWQVARFLTDAAIEVDLQRKAGKSQAKNTRKIREMRRRWFHWVADIARTSPGGTLFFAKNSSPSDLGEVLNRALTKAV